MLRTGAVGLIKCGVSGLNGISLDIDKLCKYAGENEEYMEALQEIIDMLGAHGALLTFEVEEVLTPERFEKIIRASNALDLDAIVELATYINSTHEGSNRYLGTNHLEIGDYLLAISIGLALLEVAPQVLDDIHDNNDRIEDKTIEDVIDAALGVALGYYITKGMAHLFGKIGFKLFGIYGGVIGFVAGTIIGYTLSKKINEILSKPISDGIIEARG